MTQQAMGRRLLEAPTHQINEMGELKTYFGQDMDKTYLDENSQFLLTGRSWGRGEGNYLLLSTTKQS